MSTESPNITIKAIARQNALTMMIFGACGLLLCILAASFWWHDYRLNIVMFFLMSLVALIIGLFKHFEPDNSFELTPEGMVYFHRRGSWQVSWDNVMIIEQPKVTQGVEAKPLSYIGIKLRDSQVLAKIVSRRLANQLLQEQRDLYFLGCQLEGISLLERQINDSPFKMANGEKVIGPIGAWLHRTEMLRRNFGYDLFIPLDACDREPDAFVTLLKECKEASIGYSQTSDDDSND
jgi:hypothetical protein